MLFICREFLINHRQRVVVVGATVVSGSQSYREYHREVCSDFRCSSKLLAKCFRFTSEMFQLAENRFVIYAVDYTLLTVVRKPVERADVAAFLKWTLQGFKRGG